MNAFVVDTNVLIYAAESDAPEHRACRDQLARWRARVAPWYLTWSIVYEFLRVTTHPRVFRHPWTSSSSIEFINNLLVTPAVRVLSATPRHASVLQEVVSSVPHLSGNLWHDAHTVALMQEHGVGTIVTRDTDFHRFELIEVVDPLG